MPDSASLKPQTVAAFDAALPIASIAPDPHQPRRHFDEAALAELAASIAEFGVIQPILVRPSLPLLHSLDQHWTIVAGERRWRAAQLAGLTTIPATIRSDLNADAVAVLQLVENLQRADLSLWETSVGCSKLVASIGLDAAAQRLGYSKPWVSQRANLTGLDPAIVELIEAGKLNSVDVAHDLDELSRIDETGAHDAAEWIERIANGNPPTREVVRDLLREARADVEAEAARERQREQQRADARDAEAERDPLILTPPDDDDDAPEPAAKPKASKPPQKTETPQQREMRLRHEAWTEILPDCRKLARNAHAKMLGALKAVDSDPLHPRFALSVEPPINRDTECPAQATGARYAVDVRGGTADAGLIIEALEPGYRVNVTVSVTIAELRQIEVLLNETLGLQTHSHHGGEMKVHGSKLAEVDTLVMDAYDVRQHDQQESLSRQRLIHALLDSYDAAAPASAPPAAAPEDADQQRSDIAAFFRACTQRDDSARAKAGDVHAAYSAWCERHGLEPLPLKNQWGAILDGLGIQKKRYANGWNYAGIKLLIEADA